jgi:hypothetical protein
VIVVVQAGAAEAASDIAVDDSPVATRSGKAARITQRRTLFIIIPPGRACAALPRPQMIGMQKPAEYTSL